MNVELDHIFIAVSPNAPEAEVLKDFGLTEGVPNQHLGQGTANRRFFFENAFIELLYLTDEAEAQSEAIQGTHLYERLKQHDSLISPFGVCFRYQQVSENQLPFPCWDYHPPYLPVHLSIPMAIENPLTEPLWFVLPFGIAPALAATDKLQPLQHQTGYRQLTKVQVTQTAAPLSIAAQQAKTLESFHIQQGTEQLLELSFDHAQHSLNHDFRPVLPLIFHW